MGEKARRGREEGSLQVQSSLDILLLLQPHRGPTVRINLSVFTNSSLRSLIEVEEHSYFHPDPLSPDDRTLFRQETRICCKPFLALAAVAEMVEQWTFASLIALRDVDDCIEQQIFGETDY